MRYTFLPEPNIIHIATLIVLSFVKECVHLSFEISSKMICYQIFFASLTQKILACVTPLRIMRLPPIYPVLPHLHNHGLAMLACITPFRNMCLSPVY
jgi:hypothetical protein